MKKSDPGRDYLFRKILVPVVYGCDPEPLLEAARAMAGEGVVLLVGLVIVGADESLSRGATRARKLRRKIRDLADGRNVRSRSRVRVSHDPLTEITDMVRLEEADLLVLGMRDSHEVTCSPLDSLISNPPCDIALVRGPIPDPMSKVLVAIRGGPYAELALMISLALSRSPEVKLASLHVFPTEKRQQRDGAFRGIARVLESLPEVKRKEYDDQVPEERILEVAGKYDVVVLGATGHPVKEESVIGPVADRVLNESPSGVIIVKTKKPMPPEPQRQAVGQAAISILVDKWFAENTFHADEFSDLENLLSLKEEQGLSISLALPALNEEKTIGNVITTNKTALMEQIPLLDEIVLMDSGSDDRTREIAADLGIPVYIHQEILTGYGPRRGKGEALWKSLYVTGGDIVVWVDTDIVNIHPRFVFGILGPLLAYPRILYCKGYYRRPLRVGEKMQAGGGGRVTELTARPLFNLLFPELSGLIQPLAGEYGGRRSALERVPFYSGYGVETGLLIELKEKFGLGSIAQVDLLERIHHNQSLEALSKMSFAIIQVVMRKLEQSSSCQIMEEVHQTLKLIRRTKKRYFLEVETIAEEERPPMIQLPEYRARHSGR
jgi:glucosyl-3-phosphoglycerate synthase